METMKRAISFFMALVLVLGMVPGAALSAAAEEVETQPETVAVETTEAPAETEAQEIPAETEAETLPEETVTQTVPEETVPEETVPGETVPGETLPEEVVPAETAPAETVPEEAEAAQELIPVQDPANAAVEPTGITLKASTERTYVGDEVQLSVSIQPEEAKQDAFIWDVESDNAAFDFDEEDGILTATTPGTVKVSVISTKDEEIKDTIEVTFVDVRVRFNLLPIDEDYLADLDEDGQMDAIRLSSGQKVEVSLKYQTNETGNDEDWKTEYLLTPDVEWSRSAASEAWASLTVNGGNGSVATLQAETVTATKQFTLTATDAIAGKDEVEVLICPNPEALEIWNEEENISGTTITIDLDAIEGGRREEETLYPLMARIVPDDAVQKIRWETSNDMVAGVELVYGGAVVYGGEEEEEEPDGTYVVVHVGGERLEGEATLTAICEEDPSIKATVTIKTVDYLQQDELAWHSEVKKLKYLIAGKSVKLKALDVTDADNKKVLTSKQVEWSLSTADKAYATISQDGVLTARNVVAGKTITVYCRVIGNEENAWLSKEVEIRPKAQSVHLYDQEWTEYTGKTLYIGTAGETMEPFVLNFRVDPSDYREIAGAVGVEPMAIGEDLGALQEVTWQSSNTAIAKISKEGEVKWQGKDGTVTITATAADGSGKSASMKIKFGKFAETVEIKCPISYVRSGETVTMTRKTDPSGAKLTWSLADGDEKYASISSSGRLTVKTIYEKRKITVIAKAEGSGIEAEATVEIRPSKDGILTLYSDDVCVTKTTQQLDVATGSIELTARIVGEEDPEDVKWSYPTATVKKVSDDGNGTAVFAMKKTGTATVKATSLSTGKTATVTLKGIRQAVSIHIVENENMELSAGKSMTLKAKLYDAEDKTPTRTTVRWSVSGDGAAYVTISSGGKLTVKSSYKGDALPVTVTARTTDGSDIADSCEVMIRPKATGVVIQRNDVNRVSMTYEIKDPDDVKFRLTALVYPLDQASDAVKWTSSNTKIATVSSTGVVTCKGTGTVTIKATAKDGSGKSASLKLTITKPVSEISFDGNSSYIGGGKTLTLKPEVLAADGKKPSNRAVTWSISGDTAYVSSFKNGVLKTKKVTERKYVTITATAKDGSDVSASIVVKICPATTSVQILNEDGSKVGSKTLYMRVGDELDLSAISYANGSSSGAAQTWTWSSSSKSCATVDSDGLVRAKKAGTVTIKAMAKDGTKKYDTVKIKILK